ncbi:hypothetical protein GGTG_00135 [Gaeumannomyces tritici R3-111a-1]|uniref:Uncharacterized protein n=1 Tax=Gaeumannomyces tritici (strain R3-111a-1) TaxID=644352 RepID=J3NFU1_GAET3|nr:hypothetical protein GGTG_00135 [Gaeumannomyces tritici R3-111a-1]EJT80131.1 hypothetical protein GGTG_00135 [Gaeumannomyces tritici R3-111a-1]
MPGATHQIIAATIGSCRIERIVGLNALWAVWWWHGTARSSEAGPSPIFICSLDVGMLETIQTRLYASA